MYEQFTNFYDIERKKEEKREKIPELVTTGILGVVIGQFITDIFFSFFFTEDNALQTDIKVSQIPLYYASVASGIIIGISSQYVDKFALIVISSVFFKVVNNLMDSLIDESQFEITETELVESIIATTIILYVFNPYAYNDYINHYNERHCIETEPLPTNSSIVLVLLISVITNSYFGVMNAIRSNGVDTPTSPVIDEVTLID